MSPVRPPKVVIRVDRSKVSKASFEVDGQPMPMVKSYVVEHAAGEMQIVTVTFFAEVRIVDGEAPPP